MTTADVWVVVVGLGLITTGLGWLGYVVLYRDRDDE